MIVSLTRPPDRPIAVAASSFFKAFLALDIGDSITSSISFHCLFDVLNFVKQVKLKSNTSAYKLRTNLILFHYNYFIMTDVIHGPQCGH